MTFRAILVLSAIFLGTQTMAQGTSVAFNGLRLDPKLPVEVTSDQLTVKRAQGTAVAIGHVVVGQGTMRLTSVKLRIEYSTSNGNQIHKMVATGNVVFVNGTDAAEAASAVYTLADGQLVMTGNVILTQGKNAMSGNRLVVDLASGTGVMQGRVKTIFQPASKTSKTGGN